MSAAVFSTVAWYFKTWSTKQGSVLDSKSNRAFIGQPKQDRLDGLWKAKDGYTIIVEVKTTDAYQLNLDTLANYRKKLAETGRIDPEASSILLVVGRKDTGGLEAQTRRLVMHGISALISIDALLKLVRIKQSLSDSTTVDQIQEIIKPLEYTRVDRLIDII